MDTGDSVVVSPTETTTYHAQAFDGTCWSYTCDEVTVTVNCAPPAITMQPVGGVICTGHDHELCVAATGSGELHYQWKRNGLSLIGAISPCYTATQAGIYYCVVTDDCGPTDSDTADVAYTTPGAGDFNGDGTADLDDFAQFPDCLDGPGNGIAEDCECVDGNGDGQIDLNDFAGFQILFAN